jgi:amino acid transporter
MKLSLAAIKHTLLGKPLDPFRSDTRHNLALVTFFAWVGIGADAISSANYGPEEAFLALGVHTHLAIFLALATAFTVFILAAAYTQVIELFPNGGGGYRIASSILGPKVGLVSGAALLVDYILTIAISIASGTDALFSLLPVEYQNIKLLVACLAVGLMAYLNLRGMKESIRFLLPIFIGFIITHGLLIIYGIFAHADGLDQIMPAAVNDSYQMSQAVGWFGVLALFFRAFSLGGGTYTGLEAVSSSMLSFAEPRVKTAKATMWAIAFSLAFTAGGIILLYLLWGVTHVEGETLNATAFKLITADWEIAGMNISSAFVTVALICAAGLLVTAANTGFIAGPNVLAAMAVDRWMPHMFSSLSTRLVTKNGVLLMGGCALGALMITGGDVSLLVILYSINVFLTFTLTLASVMRHRWRERGNWRTWHKIFIVLVALTVCVTILATTLIEKFHDGAWKTVLFTGALIFLCLRIHRHYASVHTRMEEIEKDLGSAMLLSSSKKELDEKPRMDPRESTAVFLVGGSAASGMHTFLWVQRLFPGTFKNFVFASVGEIDTEEFADEARWHELRRDTKAMLKNYVDFCTSRGLPATYYHDYGTDVIDTMNRLTERITTDFPRAVFFATKLIFEQETMAHQLLHNQLAYMLQRKLHNKGQNLIIMPMKI